MKEFKAQSKKLLDLVVNSIYVNREIFLRELISNASDAIDKRRFMSLTDASLDADFGIELKADKAARTLTVSDNGIGMSEEKISQILKGELKEVDLKSNSNGIGLGNVIERLKLYTGREDVMEIKSAGKDEGSEFTVKVPAHI